MLSKLYFSFSLSYDRYPRLNIISKLDFPWYHQAHLHMNKLWRLLSYQTWGFITFSHVSLYGVLFTLNITSILQAACCPPLFMTMQLLDDAVELYYYLLMANISNYNVFYLCLLFFLTYHDVVRFIEYNYLVSSKKSILFNKLMKLQMLSQSFLLL